MLFMYVKTINHPSGAVTYTVYTRDEADIANVKYKHWREAQEGEYLLTDDDWVAKVIKRKEYEELGYGKRVAVYITSPVGSIIWRKSSKNKKFKKSELHNIHAISGKRKNENATKEKRNKQMAKWYAISGDFPFSVQMAYGNVTPAISRRLRTFSRTVEFKKMVTEEMKALLDQHNLGKGDTMSLLEEALQMAREKENVTGFIRLVENLIDLNKMNETDKVTDVQLLSAENQRVLDDVVNKEAELIEAGFSEAEIEEDG